MPFPKKKRANKKEGTIQVTMPQQIVVRPPVIKTQDIDTWMSALKSAKAINPIRVALYDLYDSLLLDGHLSSVAEKRVIGVTKTKMLFLDAAGKEVKAIQDLIKTSAWRKLRKELRLAKQWGVTVVELSRRNNNLHIYSIPRKHIKPNLGRIVFEQYGQDGYDYRQAPYDRYIVEVGEPDDLGLILKAAPYVIYKRGGFGDWSQYAEIFGMPFREATYDGYNDTTRAQLQLAMEQAGSAAYVIMPKDAQFKIHEARGTAGSTDLYDKLRRACNEEICVLFLGQTETTTSSKSSGYAQSQTHADVEAGLLDDDREEELSYFNEFVLPVLANLGYPVTGGSFVHEAAKEKISQKDKADVVIKLKKEANLPVGDDYLYEEFNIPKPADYDAQKQAKEEQVPNDPPVPPDPKASGNKKLSSIEDEEEKSNLTFWQRLRLTLADFFDPAPKI